MMFRMVLDVLNSVFQLRFMIFDSNDGSEMSVPARNLNFPSSWYFWTNIGRKSKVMFQNCSGIVFWIQNMIEKHNGQWFGPEITIYIVWILVPVSSSWYFWTKIGRKSNVDFWKLDRDVFFDLTYQVLQLRMEINRSEAIGSFSESSPNFDAGAGVSEPRFCGFDQEGDFWSKNKYHQSIRNWILRLERSLELQ